MIKVAVWTTKNNNQHISELAHYLCGLLNNCMNYNKKKKRLTPAQYLINKRARRDSAMTDSLIKANGLDPGSFSTFAVEILRAQLVASQLHKTYGHYLSTKDIELIRKFTAKVCEENACYRLKPNVAYPILNLATKIKRRAHKDHELVKKKIQAARYNQP